MTSSAAPRQNRNPIQRAVAHQPSWLSPSISALVLGATLVACGAGEEADGAPAFGNLSAFPNSSPNGTGGNTGTTPANNTTNTGTNSGSQTGTNTNTGTTPAPSPSNTNSNTPTPAPPSNEGNPTAPPINNGTSMNGAMASGSGGAGNGGMPTSNPNPPVTTPNPPVTTPNPPVTTPTAPTTPDITCPTGASFCSGFESDTLPMGATYQSQPTLPIAFDTTVKHSGTRSLKVVSAGGFNIRQVVAPIPGQSFWVRLFVQTSDVFGDNNHDSLFVASTANPSQDNNAEDGPEFSEQGNQIILNASDVLFSQAGPGFPQGNGPQLSANTWHCEEAFYDGGNGDVQVFSDGTQIIDAPAFKRVSYQTFRLGYIGFNTVRTVWFDDVIVAPNRVGCQ